MARKAFDFWEGTGRTRLLWPLLCILIVAGCKPKPPPPAPPPDVEVITVQPTNVPVFEEWVGTLDGFVNAQIRAQATGYLMTQDYAEGSQVKKGDLLFQIDSRPFQAVVDQANSKLAQDKAQLAKTELDVKRYTPLAKEQAISQETLDDAVQANFAAQAQVKADEAAIETARLNLGFTRITAPVDGIVGIALAQIGDLVGPSTSLLTTVSKLDPIKVYIQPNENSYLRFWRNIINSPDASNAVSLELILFDDTIYPEQGKFYSADRQVNPNTGTLQVVGIFPNEKYMLRPGQYGRVRAQTSVQTNVFLVPQRAISEMQGGYQVSLVHMSNSTPVAHIQNVKVGSQIGANWIIKEGLNAGDQLVVEGTQKANKEGVRINPKPHVTQTGTNAPPAKAE